MKKKVIGLCKEKLNSLFRCSMIVAAVSALNATSAIAKTTLEDVHEAYTSRDIIAAIKKSMSDATISDYHVAWQENERLRTIFQTIIVHPNENPDLDIFTDADLTLIRSLPDHSDARFSVPDLLLSQATCHRVVELIEMDAEHNAVQAASMLQTVDDARLNRITAHYQNVLSSLSSTAREFINATIEFWPLPGQQAEFLDTISLATELPLYTAWQVSERCEVSLSINPASLGDKKLADGPMKDIPWNYVSKSHPVDVPQPLYADSVLSLPLVRQENSENSFQHVKLAQTYMGDWQVLDAQEIRPIHHIDEVSLITTTDTPKQVLLKVEGSFRGCHSLGRVAKYRNESTGVLQVTIFNKWPEPGPGVSCSAEVTPYEILEPLPVLGLAAGFHQVIVNGSFEDSFFLSEDNDAIFSRIVSDVVYDDVDSTAYLSSQTLHIPSVSTAEVMGQYQAVEFTQQESGTWQLSRLDGTASLMNIKQVGIEQTAQLPAQVILKIQPATDSTCSGTAEVVSHFDEGTRTWQVSVFDRQGDIDLDACVLPPETYEVVYPLPVFGLEAGQYHVNVNQQEILSFMLYQDNQYVSSQVWQPIP